VEIELVVLDGELLLGKLERLFDQVDILVFHCVWARVGAAD
jgi:hypothetical protein